MKRSQQIEGYLPALDGFRAIATLMVAWFHIWQQSWLSTTLVVFGVSIDFGRFAATGFIGVELLFLIAGFCLYYPIAQRGGKVDWRSFYIKRAIRILPCYAIAVLAMSIFPLNPWNSLGDALSYIGKTLLVGPNALSASLFHNRISSVFWSLSIEVQFYMIAPLIVLGFRKNPLAVFLGSVVVGLLYRGYVLDTPERLGFLMNQLPGMIDLFVGGMFAAHVATAIGRWVRDDERRKRLSAIAATAACALFMLAFFLVLGHLYANRGDLQPMQIRLRTAFGFAGTGMLCASALCLPAFAKALGNPLCRFVSTISYNLYLWHAWIAVKLRMLGIPPSATADPHDDVAWQAQYTLYCWVLALAVAIAITYLIEKPLTKALRGSMRAPKPVGAAPAAKAM